VGREEEKKVSPLRGDGSHDVVTSVTEMRVGGRDSVTSSASILRAA
jgi:hypothetical protein